MNPQDEIIFNDEELGDGPVEDRDLAGEQQELAAELGVSPSAQDQDLSSSDDDFYQEETPRTPPMSFDDVCMEEDEKKEKKEEAYEIVDEDDELFFKTPFVKTPALSPAPAPTLPPRAAVAAVELNAELVRRYYDESRRKNAVANGSYDFVMNTIKADPNLVAAFNGLNKGQMGDIVRSLRVTREAADVRTALGVRAPAPAPR